MESVIINVINALINTNNAVTAAFLLILYLIINNQRKNTAKVRDDDSTALHAKIKKLETELANQKAENDARFNERILAFELQNKEIAHMKEQIGTTAESINDIKSSMRNMELTMTQIATIVNAIAEKAIKIEVKDKN